MTSDYEPESWVRDELGHLETAVEGFAATGVRRDGDRVVVIFRWFADPNVYEISGPIASVDGEEPGAWIYDLWEELTFGFLAHAVKTRHGAVLHARVDGEQRSDDQQRLYSTFEYLGDGPLLRGRSIAASVGTAARATGRLLLWWATAVNAPHDGAVVAQLVVTRRTAPGEAIIEDLTLSPQAPDLVDHHLVFWAIHKAAEAGMHRLYCHRSNTAATPFEFSESDDEQLVVYDITTRDMNWPQALPTTIT